MSILIKGMEMPSCGLTVTIYPDGKVVQFLGYGKKKQLGTAVPVPPHGRCIDADALKAEGWELQMFRHDEYGCSITCRSLDSEDIPTIIPAEEGDT